ncbi:UNVERIFIED_ORG: hypothetical protein ABIB52_004404 [Arthrobacter sp. UYCu721]
MSEYGLAPAAGVLSAVEGFTHASDAGRELDELRARAYGPDHDIDGDPRALARLRELEAAHRADVERRANAPTSESSAGTETAKTWAPDVAGSAGGQWPPEPRRAVAAPSQPLKESSLRSLLQTATRTWRSRLAWAAGTLVVAAAIVTTALLISARPDATLRPTAAEADDQVRTLVTSAERARWYEIDPSTLRAYGSYHDFKIWSGVNAFGSPCLVAVHRAFDYLSKVRCAPLPADLIVDVSSPGDGFDMLASDGIIRFIRRGDTVDAYIYLLPEAF